MELLYFPIKFYFMESAVNCLRPLELSQRQCLSNVLPVSHFGLAPEFYQGLSVLLHDCWHSFAQILLPLPSLPQPCLLVHALSICQVQSIPLTASVGRCLLVAAHRVTWHHPHPARISALLHQLFVACSEAHLLMTRTGQ